MVQQKKEILITALVAVALTVVQLCITTPGIYGIAEHSREANRLFYNFVHGSWLHLGINLYCLYSIVRYMKPTAIAYIVALLIAMSVPLKILSDTPTVGMSGFLFALMGLMTGYTEQPHITFGYLLAFIIFGMFFAQAATAVHLYCLIVGVVVPLIYELWKSIYRKS